MNTTPKAAFTPVQEIATYIALLVLNDLTCVPCTFSNNTSAMSTTTHTLGVPKLGPNTLLLQSLVKAAHCYRACGNEDKHNFVLGYLCGRYSLHEVLQTGNTTFDETMRSLSSEADKTTANKWGDHFVISAAANARLCGEEVDEERIGRLTRLLGIVYN